MIFWGVLSKKYFLFFFFLNQKTLFNMRQTCTKIKWEYIMSIFRRECCCNHTMQLRLELLRFILNTGVVLWPLTNHCIFWLVPYQLSVSYLPLQKGVMLSLSVPLKPLPKKTKKSRNINSSHFSMDCHCHATEAHPGQCLGLNNYIFLPFWTIHTWLEWCSSPSHRSRSSVINSRASYQLFSFPSHEPEQLQACGYH